MEQRIQNNKIEVFIPKHEQTQAEMFQEEFSALEAGYKHNTRYRMGLWNGKHNFYTVQILAEGWLFKVEKGFMKRIENFTGQKFVVTKNYKRAINFLKDEIPKLPFKPYKHQIKMFTGLASSKNHLGIAATGSGKSLVIYLLLRFYRKHNLKILVLVPTIDLVHQMKDDCDIYSAGHPLGPLSIQQIGGEFKNKEIKNDIVISTYQSAIKADLKGFDVIINDETHLASADTIQEILRNPFKIKLGLTGSPPIDKLDAMKIETHYGMPEHYINARKLIDLGLATDLSVVAVFLNQKQKIMKYQDEVKFIKTDPLRRAWISKFLTKLKGLSIALYNHTEHGTDTFYSVTGVKLKDAMSFEQQKALGESGDGVFFLSGKTKPRIRKMILDYVKQADNTKNILIIGQFKLLSTGINIKALKNLVFLASTKSYTTVIQSIGRVLRLHETKNKAVVWDLIDNFSDHRKSENYALQHFYQRLQFYEYQDFEIHEKEINL